MIRRRGIVLALVLAMLSGFVAALALADTGGGSSSASSDPNAQGASSGATVLWSTTYTDATPASPQGMSSAAAAQTERAWAAYTNPHSSDGAIVLTSTTYQDATPASPQGMSPAAAAEVERAALPRR
jgi:hypothetical protein